ncbi:MAG: hypothetical protein R3282_06515 [Rhodothermales bacterium]|nr:hypothetical protein [Rhodothermales bacterium]
MPATAEDYSLNLGQYEQALAILEREQERLRLTPRQERLYKILKFGVYTLGGALVLFLLLLLGGLAISAWFESDVGAYIVVSSYALALIGALPALIIAVATVVLFGLNLPYLRGLVRQQRLIRQYGFTGVLSAPWRARRRQKRIRNVFTFVVSVLGGLLIAAAIVYGVAYVIEEVRSDLTRVGWLEVAGFLMLLFLIAMTGLALATFHYAQRGRERLDFVRHLSQSLKTQEPVADEEDSRVRISRETYQKIAQIERAQIVRARTKSIEEGLHEVKRADVARPYLVQKSRKAREDLDLLDPTTRLRVHEGILALSHNPHPQQAAAHEGRFVFPLPDTTVRLVYRLDDDTRRLQILELEDTDTSSPPSGGPHA